MLAANRIKLTLPPDLRAYVARRVAQGGYVNAGEYMRHS
jgi:Arc/MetJ-type ribon-helix-helix transcriptional regulator